MRSLRTGDPNTEFARRVFLWAGIYGLAVFVPMYFLEARVGQDSPPPLNHPEYYYGFIGLGLAWQLAFLAIARDPIRLRPVMLAAVVEKLLFPASTFVLLAASRVAGATVVFAAIDLALAALFFTSYLRCRGSAA